MNRLTRVVTLRPQLVIVAVVSLCLLAGGLGIGVLAKMNLAGYDDPNSESSQAEALVDQTFGSQTPDVVVVYSVPPGTSINDIGPQVLDRLDKLDPALLAKPVESYWNAEGLRRMAMASADHTKALAALYLRGTLGEQLAHYSDVASQLRVPGVHSQLAGYLALTDAYNAKSKQGVVMAESVALPLMMILLVVVFGGLVAAVVPVAVGGLAVLGSVGALWAISHFTDVSVFALNIASIMGLGLAIDYSLFMVGRFREELGRGRSPAAAAQYAIGTAGRTIAFSALLLVCAFAGTMVFPISMLRSLGFGAMASIAIAALVSVTAVPAALTLLGSRINALAWRRGAVERGEARAHRYWGALACGVMRRPVAIVAGIIVVVLALSAPLLGIRMSGITPNILPADDPARMAQATLAGDFPNAGDGATLVIRGIGGARPSPHAVDQVMAEAQQAGGVSQVIHVGAKDDLVLVRALLTEPDFSTSSESSIRALQGIASPPDATVLVGGSNALRVDSYDSIVGAIPTALAVVILATLCVMTIGFRSLVLPIKAIVMAAISLASTFGILTWVFVQGHGARLLGAEPAALPLPALVVVVVAVFGLSTDYEVFLMSRMVEAHDRGATTEDAIRTGVARTGRIITAAATLFIIVSGSAALSDVTLIKVAAMGMAIAVLIDATLVRMLLVPALVTLMGSLNWWTPWRKPATREGVFGQHSGDEHESSPSDPPTRHVPRDADNADLLDPWQ
ncbi:MMPL family transporter [Nocardia elegans]|uniref:MMPL family transporter n=1 Tax=Nocardia elegans TaxID=300029 RepID=UPI0018934002|nr:MMPL family transporter [Nocardia elegans]MBF6245649.1 MMPL family transporter [Nocardia elegans]